MTQRITMNETPVAGTSFFRLNQKDLIWLLGLYGTAIGAGTLFLPINAGIGGCWPLLIMTLIAFPMTFFAHRALTRFVLSGSSPNGDITEVVDEHFGTFIGKCITFLYFFSIYPILLVYSVAITNTVSSFMEHQLHLTPPPRILLAGALIFGLMIIVRLGRDVIVKTMSFLVFPFVIALMGLALYLIPHWTSALFLEATSPLANPGEFTKTLWLAIPVIIFSFNHSPIISSFAIAQKTEYGSELADKKSQRILLLSHLMMVITVLFFVLSCVLSLSPANLMEAKAQNISILSYLANHLDHPVIAYLAPLIAFVAITKSFLGHYLGAKEGFNGLVLKAMHRRGKKIDITKLNKATAAIVGITAWLAATWNPSILSMIESLGGPIIATLLFLMPMYAIYTVPSLRRYAGKWSNVFIVLMGCIAISAIFYLLFNN